MDCLETRRSPAVRVGLGFLRVVAVPPHVLRNLTDKLIDSFRFYQYNLSLSAQVLTHKHPSKTTGAGGGGGYRKYGIMGPGLP